MTCRLARSWVALAAGGDLSSRRARRLKTHLAKCAACREESRLVLKSLEVARSMAHKERTPDWSEAEWRGIMAKAVGQEIRPRGFRASRTPGWAWAAGAALLVVLVVGAFVLMRREHGTSLVAEQGPRADIVLQEKAPSPPKPATVEPSPLEKPKPAARRSELLLTQKPVQAGAAEHARPLSPAPQTQAQSVMAMTFVSQETGLKIYWVFNDAFNYKENKK